MRISFGFRKKDEVSDTDTLHVKSIIQMLVYIYVPRFLIGVFFYSLEDLD